MSTKRNSVSPRSRLQRFDTFNVAWSTKNLYVSPGQRWYGVSRAQYRPVLSQPCFGNFPIAMSEDVVAMDCHMAAVIDKTINEVETTWRHFPWSEAKLQLKIRHTSHDNHTIPKLRMKNTVNSALYNIGEITAQSWCATTNHEISTWRMRIQKMVQAKKETLEPYRCTEVGRSDEGRQYALFLL